MSIGGLFLAAAFVAAEGGEELRLFQTTESKGFREIATSGFTKPLGKVRFASSTITKR